MYSKLVPYLYLPWDYRFGRRYMFHRRALRATERMQSVELRRFQWNQLEALMEYAYRNVPFYRRRFDEAGVLPSTIKEPSDLRRIPILTRNDVRENLGDLVATNMDRSKLKLVNTGGSTGRPVGCYKSGDFSAYQKATTARAEGWAGFQEGDKRAIVWGADRDLPQQDWFSRFRSRHILRERWLNAYNLTEEKMREFACALIEWTPSVIVGYARALHLFALFLKANKLDRIRPAAISTSAETLFDHQRETIEDVFDCPVFNYYGSRDVGGIAAECEAHKGLHVFSDSVYLELLRDGQPAAPGDVGEIIITTLLNYATPLVRYQIGDLARGDATPCSCGRPFPMLSEVVGRANDVLSTPNGQIVHGAFFNHLLFGFDEIEEFQVYQRTLNEVTISLKCRKDLHHEVVQTIRRDVMDQLGPGVEVAVKAVDAIPLTQTGKHRYMLSEVTPSFVVSPDAEG